MSLRLSVKLPGSDTYELLRVPHEDIEWCVGDLKDVIITKFKLDVTPQQLQLFVVDNLSQVIGDHPLTQRLGPAQSANPTHTLSEAGIGMGTKLVVDLAAAHVHVASVG
jgi:hypothetical protein